MFLTKDYTIQRTIYSAITYYCLHFLYCWAIKVLSFHFVNVFLVFRINPGYHEAQTLRGHTNFVNCICFCPPSESYPNGIIVTSGNDKKICGFVSEQESPLFNLQGHSDTGKLN